MRRRLVRSTLAVAVLAVVLLGVPLAVAGVLIVRDNAERTVQNIAETIGASLDRAAATDQLTAADVDAELDRIDPRYAVQVRLPGGATYTRGKPRGKGIIGAYSSPVAAVAVEEDPTKLYDEQLRAVLLVVTVSLVSIAAAVGVSLVQARRLAAPLVDLAGTAARLGSGESRLQFRRYGVQEVDQVADVLERSSERITTMLSVERQFAADASHQLRTPLAALSMRLEEIQNSDDQDAVREEARIALAQVERLASVVDHLLANARETRSATAVPVLVDDVVRQQVDEWQPAFRVAHREIVVDQLVGLRVYATPGGLAQVLATLLENSLVHGAGTVTVRCRTTGSSVVLEVGDHGPGVPVELGSRVFERSVSGRSKAGGTGLGLALARDLAEADGGRLELVQPKPAVFALFLTAAS